MFTASDLIDVLRRRRRRSIRPDQPSEGFPEGWTRWFESMRARTGAVTGATADAIVAVLVARPAPPRRKGRVPSGAWAVWTGLLLHPSWEPPIRDHRGARRFAVATALLLQVVWVGALLWLTHPYVALPAPAAEGEAHVVEAVFIGDGTPEDAGGGAGDGAPAPVAPVAQAAPSPVAPADPAAAPSAPEETSVASEAVVAADPVEPPQQVLEVTRTPLPDTAFTLPPPRPGAAPEVSVRERQVPDAQLQTVDVPALRTPGPLADAPRQRREVEVEVRERRVAQPTESLRLPTREAPQVVVEAPEVPSRPVADVVARERAVPMRDAPAPMQPTAAATRTEPAPPAPIASTASPRPPGSASTSPGSGARAPTPAPGAGQRTGDPPGAAPSTRVADDWGDSATTRDGGQPGRPSGLFGADGRARLADGGRVGGGLPPGTVTEDFARIDREGTWLKRPPTDYEPTSLDRFWVPSETLLQEWVRRSIKEVLIPIPGTSKTVKCSVALLMFGGACGITDPNMQDVETDGRPPPDVPWKPELQEDQQSLGG